MRRFSVPITPPASSKHISHRTPHQPVRRFYNLYLDGQSYQMARYPFSPGWSEAIGVNFLAQGKKHKWSRWGSNPVPFRPESNALTTRPVLQLRGRVGVRRDARGGAQEGLQRLVEEDLRRAHRLSCGRNGQCLFIGGFLLFLFCMLFRHPARTCMPISLHQLVTWPAPGSKQFNKRRLLLFVSSY